MPRGKYQDSVKLDADAIYKVLDQRDWTVAELARRAMLHRCTIDNCLRDGNRVRLSTAEMIAQALGLKPEHIIKRHA